VVLGVLVLAVAALAAVNRYSADFTIGRELVFTPTTNEFGAVSGEFARQQAYVRCSADGDLLVNEDGVPMFFNEQGPTSFNGRTCDDSRRDRRMLAAVIVGAGIIAGAWLVLGRPRSAELERTDVPA
jgi:hypothetical protein